MRKLDHLGIAVNSLGPALDRYHNLLGFQDVHIEVVPPQGVRIAMLPVPGGAEIELLEPTDPKGAVARFLERRGEGIHHICLGVADIAAELSRLKARQVPLVDEEARPVRGSLVAFLHPRACHGVLVELIQKTGQEPSQGIPPPTIAGLAHVGIVVKELSPALHTFQQLLDQSEDSPVRSTPTLRLGFVGLGNSALELLEPLDPNDERAHFLAEMGEGIHHFALTVTDLHQRLAALHQAGIVPLRVIPPENPRVVFVPPGPLHGVTVELMQQQTP